MNSFGLLLVAGLTEEGKHILLVSFHTRLVEGIDTKEVAMNTAAKFEEVDELAEVVGVEAVNSYTNIRNAAARKFRPSRFSSSLGKRRLCSGVCTLITVSKMLRSPS